MDDAGTRSCRFVDSLNRHRLDDLDRALAARTVRHAPDPLVGGPAVFQAWPVRGGRCGERRLHSDRGACGGPPGGGADPESSG